MKAADRKLALRAHRIHKRTGGGVAAVAKRLKVDQGAASHLLFKGLLIEQSEAYRLTEPEMQAMTALARVEARRVALGESVPKANQVDFAAGKRSGWCGGIIAKRLRTLRDGDDNATATSRLNLIVYPRDAGHIWLTASGWAFVWAAGLVLKNWRVPA